MLGKQVLPLHHSQHRVSQALLEQELEDIPELLPLEHQEVQDIEGLEISELMSQLLNVKDYLEHIFATHLQKQGC